MKTFVTFLGRGRENIKTGYRTATYVFPDGSEQTTAFFGIALAKYIKPENIVILGTSSSQWSVLVENFAQEGDQEDERLQLIDLEIQGKIEQSHLNKVTDLMCQAVGCNVLPRLIPFGKNEPQQYEILDVIAMNVPQGRVDFDLTHGFRHFGMIGFLSAFMLARLQDIEVNNLWYGALEMTQNDRTPVLKLEGLDRVRQWVEALNRFEATGNYRVFAELLIKDGVEPAKATHLKNAAFHERTLNLTTASQEIQQFQPVLERKLNGASGLFQQELAKCLKWVDLQKLSEQQAELARKYLAHRDYLRASIFAWEALVSHVCEKNGINPNCSNTRQNYDIIAEVAQWPLRDGQEPGDNREAAQNLMWIRNALAHATQDRQRIFDEEDTLRQTLKSALQCLLPM